MKAIANGRRHMVLPVACHISAVVSGAHKCPNISSLTWFKNCLEGVWMTATVFGNPKLSIEETGFGISAA